MKCYFNSSMYHMNKYEYKTSTLTFILETTKLTQPLFATPYLIPHLPPPSCPATATPLISSSSPSPSTTTTSTSAYPYNAPQTHPAPQYPHRQSQRPPLAPRSDQHTPVSRSGARCTAPSSCTGPSAAAGHPPRAPLARRARLLSWPDSTALRAWRGARASNPLIGFRSRRSPRGERPRCISSTWAGRVALARARGA